MTPQERQLVDELFDRLAQLENAPREPEAERLITDGARRAPHSLYALVQTVLVQDEALKRANERIEDLQAQLGGDEQPQQRQGGFLDNMREALFGQQGPHGSVPTVRRQGPATPPGYQNQADYPPQRPAFASAPPTAYPAGPFAGGSFLGNAAATAAGVIGGAMLLNGIRSMFGQHSGLGGQSAFGSFGDPVSPWKGDAASSDLAREAGVDHIGQHAVDAGTGQTEGARIADTDDGYAQDDGNFTADDDSDFADGGGGDFGGGDSDFA